MHRVIVAVLTGVVLASAMPAHAAGVGPFAKSDYPVSLIDRPLTLPSGMVEARLEAAFTSFTIPLGAFDPNTQRFGIRDFHFDNWDLVGNLAVGITDRLQVELGTSFSISEGRLPGTLDFRPSTASWDRNLNVRLSYLALDTETFDVAPAIAVPFHIDAGSRTVHVPGSNQVFRVEDQTDVVELVAVETPARWTLGRHVWLEGGRDLATISTDPGAAFVSFVGGLGVQASASFATVLDMNFAELVFDGQGADTRTLDDAVPLRLTGLLALCRWADLTGGLTLRDARDGFDFYQLRIGVTVRL